MTTHTVTNEIVRKRLEEYARKSKVLRQIHSNKGTRANRWNMVFLVVTVVVATSLSVIGFMGTDGISASFFEGAPSQKQNIETIYNLSVLAILVLTILGLIFRFEERGAQHYRSIETLTEFIRDVEDRIVTSDAGVAPLVLADLESTRQRYKGLLATLPPSTDREYLRAKKTAREKANAAGDGGQGRPNRSEGWTDATRNTCVEPQLADRLATLLGRHERRDVLRQVRDSLGATAWVVGGFIREPVWDELQGYSLATPNDDIDVVYFDRRDITRASEAKRIAKLRQAVPNLPWSVKNQARMHTTTGQRPYVNLEDAVAHYPETASAIACRLDEEDRLVVLAPHGLADLFNGIIRPTPGFDCTRFRERARQKDWAYRWPKLVLLPPIGSVTSAPARPPSAGGQRRTSRLYGARIRKVVSKMRRSR